MSAAAAAMRGFTAPWAFAGGWAIDLALGTVTREHADVDLATFRDDQHVLRDHLDEWTWTYADGEALWPWHADHWLDLPIHEVHALPPAFRGGSALEFLLNERHGDDWAFRRDARIRLPLWRAIRISPSGLPVLAPEIVLLFKSKAPRARDDADFAHVAPRLDASERDWLVGALQQYRPGHPWIVALDGSTRE